MVRRERDCRPAPCPASQPPLPPAAQIARLVCYAICVLACLLPFGGRALAQGSAGTVAVLEVEGVIDPVVARYVQRGLAGAEERNAALVVLALDTPGGLDSSMRTIIQAILASPVPVAAYVSPAGARAASAGTFIVAAAHLAAMAPGTSIGAAHPVGLGSDWSATEQDKVTNDAVAYIRALAEQRGRNVEWVEEAVRRSASASAEEALRLGVIDFIAGDLDALLAAADGRKIAAGDRTVTLDLGAAVAYRQPMTVLEAAAHILVNPDFAYALLTIGVLGIVAELYHPGAIVPGVTGVICLLLAFVGLGNLPANWGGVGLIALAVALFVLDVHVSGFLLSIGGVIAFVLGSLLLFSPFAPTAPALPDIRVSPWLVVMMTTLVTGFVAVLLGAAVRAIRRAPVTGPATLLGQTGTVTSPLAPEGIVHVRGETWVARSESGDLAAGEPVVVVAIDGLKLTVRRQS